LAFATAKNGIDYDSREMKPAQAKKKMTLRFSREAKLRRRWGSPR
jgi:hypothetical protein